MSAGRRRLFTVLMLAFPVVIFAAAEGALRLFGVGSAHPLFIQADSAGRYLRMNPRVSERYFYGDYTAPGATHDPFRSSRRPETFRIVVQGGSTALGFPFFYGAAFPRMLESRLQEALPDREIEVVNTALTAVNSHTLLDLAHEIVEQRPDAVLIYAGHNEYYGAFGVASTRAGRHTWWVSTYLGLRRLRLVQFLSAAMDALAPSSPPAADGHRGTTMQRMVGERVIPLGSDLYEAGLDQFERNLNALLRVYGRAKIPVYLATLASNERDRPPFISQPDASVAPEAWEAAMGVALSRLDAGDPSGALAALEGVRAGDRTNADAFFRAAALFDSASAHPQARVLYQDAKDRDLLRFRAPEAINTILREAAVRHGAVLVDVQAAFASASPGGIVGGELMTEHVHPTIDGYFVLADAFYGALCQSWAIGAQDGAPSREEARSRVPVTAVDSIYGELLLRSLTAGWPFQDDPTLERRALEELRGMTPSDPVANLALLLFRGETSWRDAMMSLYTYHRFGGMPEEAERAARALALEFPLSSTPWELLAGLVLDADSLEHALSFLQRGWAVERSVGGAMQMGGVHLRQGRYEEAPAFRWAVELAPPGTTVPRMVLDAAEALPRLEEAVQAHPRDPDALHALAWAYVATNLTAEARLTVDRLVQVEAVSDRVQRLLAELGPVTPSEGARLGRTVIPPTPRPPG